MRRLLLVLAACGQAALPPVQPKPVPRLLPPRPIDPAARGAGYLTSVALQLQPGWGQFLDDCRLRLPATHPLNDMALAATAELVVARDGRIESVTVATSKNPDFDRAVRDAIADAGPLAAPPAELLSDDDKVHLRWLFARDRRQAGPATAEVMEIQQPLHDVVMKWTKSGELARAAKRLLVVRSSSDREESTRRVMVAALREALAGANDSAKRAAIEAIGRAKLGELASEVRALIPWSGDAAIETAAELGDPQAAAELARMLPQHIRDLPRLALAEARALATLHHTDVVGDAARDVLDEARAYASNALEVLQYAPAAATKLAGRFGRGDARERAASCKAAAAAELYVAWVWIGKGLHDADASVRAACIDAAHAHGLRHYDKEKHVFDDRRIAPMLERIRELARDRDRAVRARAVAALELDPDHAVRAADDPAAEVRAAYASTITAPQLNELRALLDDRDPQVRAAAWTREAAIPLPDRVQLAVHAMADPASEVRRAALQAVDDDHLSDAATSDDSPDVRTDALVLLVQRRGRAEMTRPLLERLAAAPPASTERVRVALAWLLAK